MMNKHAILNTPTLIFMLLFGLSACDESSDINAPLQEESSLTGNSHNAGQNCLRCHNKPNRNTPVFTVAGTIYDRAEPAQPYAGTTVNLYSDGQNNNLLLSIKVDQSGNFYSKQAIDFNNTVYAEVVSAIGTIAKINPAPHGDCNKCHDHGNEPRIFAID